MDIFHYHPQTGEYIGPGTADVDPMDERRWLMPAYSTTVAPIEGAEKKVRVFEAGQWKLEPDHRGETWWRTEAEYNTEPVVIDFIGEPSESLTPIEPPAPPLPPEPGVTPRQIRKALSEFGLRQAVEDFVNASGLEVQDAWHYALLFERNDPLIALAATALGKTDQEVDALFELARSV